MELTEESKNIYVLDLDFIKQEKFLQSLISGKINLTLVVYSDKDDSTKGFITDFHVNLFSSFFDALLKKREEGLELEGTLVIDFSKCIKKFEFSFIGLIALFKETFTGINVTIKIPDRSSGKSHYRFKNVLTSIQTWYGSYNDEIIYEIKCNDDSNNTRELVDVFLDK